VTMHLDAKHKFLGNSHAQIFLRRDYTKQVGAHAAA
jgi:hypothetical protein